jgi:hypothetical protein
MTTSATTATTATTAKSTPIKASEAATAAIISLPDATQIDKDSILLAYVKNFMVKKFHHLILVVIFVKLIKALMTIRHTFGI